MAGETKDATQVDSFEDEIAKRAWDAVAAGTDLELTPQECWEVFMEASPLAATAKFDEALERNWFHEGPIPRGSVLHIRIVSHRDAELL
jgi:hypothetical protein